MGCSVLSHEITINVITGAKILKNKSNNGFRRILALGVMAVEEQAEAQQFKTGVSLNVVRQPGYANFNPA